MFNYVKRLELERCLINFLVNSPVDTWFMKSIDASDTIKNGELMFKYLDEVVEEIGEENVVQVIIDNASNYVNPGMRLMEKEKIVVDSLCAHCIDLMLEDIGKLNVHATTLSQARQVVKFIYGHTWDVGLSRMFKATFSWTHMTKQWVNLGVVLQLILNIKKSYKLVDAFWGTSELQKFAIRVLSLTCSASGCERN
ncbi:hypothetical protein CK203_116285 [Vitis vinifera]|uniref:DUF659 domain-containing protein n=1 Tax=Vitis vinifera TaxID=29760 RepID=A0A438C8M0_VITVI|nr:hypothetical protein CK203_116285 [Vitis vinifera]